MRALLRLMRHEGWSYDVDVFDENVISNDPRDLWSANCEIPDLLFSDAMEFERNVSDFRVLRNELCKGLIFPLSGGIVSKTKMIQLPKWLLSVVDRFDQLATQYFQAFLQWEEWLCLRSEVIRSRGRRFLAVCNYFAVHSRHHLANAIVPAENIRSYRSSFS